jgi:mRNA-degrading endonuclease RelE of RelBE toxin-antitoxin system
MRFVETPVFTAAVTRLLDDEAYRHLQIALMLRPEQGPIVRGSGGFRKVRWARPGSGRRGGLRVIYYWAPVERVIYMLSSTPKTNKAT